MINCSDFFTILEKVGFEFYIGVPCTILKPVLNFINDHKNEYKHIIATSEGEAVAIAAGYHLSTGKIPIVYMQNSGLGNSVNPLTSLTNKEVGSIPVLLLISWRGRPGVKDAPEHIRMGSITEKLLETLGIPTELLPDSKRDIFKVIDKAKKTMLDSSEPYAILVKRGIFQKYEGKEHPSTCGKLLSREDAVKMVAERVYSNGIIVTTTGKISRELFEYLERKGMSHDSVFYTVGSMGCSSGISLGVSLHSKRKVFLFDGDGALLMKLGSLATIGYYRPNNFYHIVFDNQSYESTGGQPTVSENVNFAEIAKSCGYIKTSVVETLGDIKNALRDLPGSEGPYLLVIKVKPGSRKDLGRPTVEPCENKNRLMDFIRSNK